MFNEAASLWQHQCKNLRLSCILFQTISISLETGIFAHKKSFSEKIRKSLIKRKEGLLVKFFEQLSQLVVAQSQ